MAVDYADAALAAARRYCGWIVTPPETVTVTVDGPGRRPVLLRSLHVTNIVSVVEDGVTLDVADLRWSETGAVHKKHGFWTCKPASIAVRFTHGYDEAPDFDAAVEQAAHTLSVATIRDDPAMKRKRIDDVDYEWYGNVTRVLNTGLLDPYRILLSP